LFIPPSYSDSVLRVGEADVFKYLIFINIMLSMLLFPLSFSFADQKEIAHRTVTKQFRMGDFQLTTIRDTSNNEYSLYLEQNGEVVLTSSCAFKVHEPRIVPEVPAAGCKSLLAYCYSGGAHCCMSLLIATECREQKSLSVVDLAHSAGEVKFARADNTKSRQMKITDWRFAYYGPEDSAVQLSFAASPGMTRLLVFDNGNWRADKVGEFIPFYSLLLRETMEEARIKVSSSADPEILASKAMKAAYYSVLAGRSDEEQLGLLKRLLPENWKPESENVLKDIREGVQEFNPVEVIQ
jgi:hypothetical protein